MGLFDRIAAWLDDRPVKVDSSLTVEHTDINPATGLPTVGGAGTPDVAGNPYGVLRSHDHEYDWQRHDRWDSVGQDHHHDSWPGSSMDNGHDSWRD